MLYVIIYENSTNANDLKNEKNNNNYINMSIEDKKYILAGKDINNINNNSKENLKKLIIDQIFYIK